MSRLLLIETSAALCSVALSENGNLLAYRESETPRSHAAMTAVLIEQVLSSQGLRIQDCDAVCVSEGPGSYTGLRVGVSSAKGLCFGAGIPLLAVGTLDILVAGALSRGEIPAGCDAIYPVIDARRNEIYTAPYQLSAGHGTSGGCVSGGSASASLRSDSTDEPSGGCVSGGCVSASLGAKRVGEVRPLIVGVDEFEIHPDGKQVVFIGDAAEKCQCLLSEQGADISHCTFIPCQPKASDMCTIAQQAFDAGNFKDVAYFEPFYLKEFVATVSKKKLF